MSLFHTETVPCPQCGKPIEFTLWQTINSEIPSAMEDVISGKLFDVECAHCGLKTRVNYPILVNDMEHDVMIRYTLPEGVEEAKQEFRSLRDMYWGRTRIVTYQNSLREKLSIFRAGLDDRVAEFMKVLVLSKNIRQLEGKEIRGVYYVPGDEAHLEILFDGSTGQSPVSRKLYEEVEKHFGTCFPEKDEELVVDGDWVRSVFPPG